jgi:hypothetical protein
MPTNPRIIKPFLRRNMERPELFGRDNLCSTLRDIYMKAKELGDEDIQLWARMSVRMAKNMYNGLADYKAMLIEAGYPVGHDSREDWQLRKRSLKQEKK